MPMLLRLFCCLNKNSARCYPVLYSFRSASLQPSSTYVKNTNETFEQKNLRLKRPLSPHLTIYTPQLTTVLSIFHRITGLAITGYVVFIAASSYYDLGNLIANINNLHISPPTFFAIKTVLALPVSYHFLNGIRHLIWDVGQGLSIKGVYTSGYLVVAGTILFSLYLASFNDTKELL